MTYYCDDDDERPLHLYGPSEPNPALQSLDLEGVASFIASNDCKKIVVLSGAGVSVTSGIPPFRGKGGLYDSLHPELLTATDDERAELSTPEAVFSADLFFRNPLPYFEVKRPLLLGVQANAYQPTLFHRLLELLASKTGKHKRVFSQNIDGLEFNCGGLPASLIRNPHGRMNVAKCDACGRGMLFDDFCEKVRTQIKDIYGDDPSAPRCSTKIECDYCGAPAVKSDTVLFGSRLQLDVAPEQDPVLEDVDLLIVAGTSLLVAPINGAKMPPPTPPRTCVPPVCRLHVSKWI